MDGTPLSSLSQLISMQATGCMHFRAAVATMDQAHGVTHILDLGPGGGRAGDGVGGSAQFAAAIKEGAGVRVILARITIPKPEVTDAPHIGGFDELMSDSPAQFGPNWAVEHAPKLSKRASDGKVVLDTKFTRVRVGVCICSFVPICAGLTAPCCC